METKYIIAYGQVEEVDGFICDVLTDACAKECSSKYSHNVSCLTTNYPNIKTHTHTHMHGCTRRYIAAEKVGILLGKLMGIKYLSGWVQMCLIQIVIFLFAASLSLMNDWSQRSAMINGSTLAPLHALLILLLYYPYNPAGCFALCTQAHTHTRASSHVYLCKHIPSLYYAAGGGGVFLKWEDK